MVKYHAHLILSVLLLLMCFTFSVQGYPANRWRYLSGKWFEIAYCGETEHCAKRALRISEAIGRKLFKYFGYDLGKEKISVVLYDDEDYSNGSSSIIRPLVTINCRRTPMLWRNQTDWLTTVLSHEIAHTFSIDVMKKPQRFFADIRLESETDNYDVDMGTYMEHNELPIWFVEGIAQMGSERCNADSRDAFREMILYDAYRQNRLLSYGEMERFEGTSREYELAYNQGYDMVRFLLHSTSPSVSMGKLCKQVRDHGFRTACLDLYNKSPRQLYKDWRASLEKRFSSVPFKNSGRKIYPKKKGALTLEVATADNGRFVVANWRHDYQRYDLYKQDASRMKLLAKEVAPMLAYDASTKTLWYSREVYSHRTGTEIYELFSLKENGRPVRETKGARCMAFDARDGRLIYAAYRYGKTDIIERFANGRETVVHQFPYDTTVFRISIAESGKILLSLGCHKDNRLAVLEKNRFQLLAPQGESDMLDGAWVHGDTIVFIGTAEGYPLLYCCDISRNENEWFRLHGGIGARNPTAGFDGNTCAVYCPVYSSGEFRVTRLEQQLSEKGIFIPDEAPNSTEVKEFSFYRTETFNRSTRLPTAMPVAPPVFSIGYSSDEFRRVNSDTEFSDTSITVSGPFVSGSFMLMNAPSTFKGGTDLGVYFFPRQSDKPVNKLGLNVWVERDFGPVLCTVDYDALRYIRVGYSDKDQFVTHRQMNHSLQFSVKYQLSRRQVISIGFTPEMTRAMYTAKLRNSSYHYRETNSDEIVYKFGPVYKSRRLNILWGAIEARSCSDPARLGQPEFSAAIGGFIRSNTYPVKDTVFYFDTSEYRLNPTTIFYSSVKTNAQHLLFGSRLSMSGTVEGFLYRGNYSNNRISPYSTAYIGNAWLFSGYPSGYADVITLAKAECEVRANPFVSNDNVTRWYERMHIGFKGEVGAVEYFDRKRAWMNPVSIETALRFWWYLRPATPSTLYVKYALPLTDRPDKEVKRMPRWYFGMTL